MRSAVVSVVLASLVLAAVIACPCPAMAAPHGCCGGESAMIAPSECCRAAASPAQWTPRTLPAAPVASFAAVVVSVLAAPASPPPEASRVSLPASPPRVLRI